MNPVIGPTQIKFGVAKYPGEYSNHYESKTCYSQTPPFNLALPYKRLVSVVSSFTNTTQKQGVDYIVGNASYIGTFNNCYPNFATFASLLTGSSEVALTVARAKNMVYEKIVAELGDRIELLVTVAERRESYGMVVKRLTDLYRFVKALRHPNANQMRQFFTGSALPRSFRETLKYHLRNWRRSTKDLGQLWLELHFGWEPIVRDIDTSLQRMAAPIPEGDIDVQSRKLPFKRVDSYKSGGSSPYWKTSSTVAGSVKCYGSATVAVDNPTEVYKTVLGLNNPVLVAYSLIPYTWMFDWVNYLGTYISSFSDLAGYKVVRASHSVIVRAAGVFSYEYPLQQNRRKNAWSGAFFERTVGLPRVTLTWKPLPKQLSVIRGATLASLLSGLLDPTDPAWKEQRKLKPLRST